MSSEEEFLTKEQIEEILDVFHIPFNTFKVVVDCINEEIRVKARSFLEEVKIYPDIFLEYKEHLRNKFHSSLIEPGAPIGAITSDAIGQQATQALLNTFHSVGTAKSGGPDGIKENIGISSKRKILYSIIHFKNAMMNYADVMKLNKIFTGIPLSKLFISNSKPESVILKIYDHIKNNPYATNISYEEKKSIFLSDKYWWYCGVRLDDIYQYGNDIERTCLRLKFDVQKLYEFKLTTYKIAEFINKWIFKIAIPKKSQAKASDKREYIVQKIYCVPSPTHIGIIDLFIKSQMNNDDHLCISLIHSNEFDDMIISGIEGIKIFYAVNTSVTRLIRDVEETNRFDEENGKNGMWLYLNDNRFNGIPYLRLLNILDKAAIKYELPYFNTPNSYKDNFTDLPFEFFSHKCIPDLRTKLKIKAYLYDDMISHDPSSYLVSNSYENGNIEWSLMFQGYSDIQQYGSIIVEKEFYNVQQVSSFISKFNNSINKEVMKILFPNATWIEQSYSIVSNSTSILCFPIKDNGRTYYVNYLACQKKKVLCENKYYTYKKLKEGFDVCFYPFSTSKNYEGILCPKKFKDIPELLKILDMIDNRITFDHFKKMFNITDSSFDNFFGNFISEQIYRIVNFQCGDMYVNYYIFKMKFIEYDINVNLDYLNSHFSVSSLDAMLDNQFSIPYKFANKDGINLSDSLRKYRVLNTEILKDKPEARIFIKSKMFLTDKFDFIGKEHREIRLKYTRALKKDMSKNEKENLLHKLIPHGTVLTKDMFNEILDMEKLNPLQRLNLYIKQRTSEEDLNYVYAETSGSNFNEINKNELVLKNKTISNDFHQVYHSLGLEGLRNLLTYDIINAINGSGYIAVEYMNFSSNVTTHNGINQMTSEGITCQDRGFLDLMTFDNAYKYIHIASTLGKEQDTSSTSSCIFLGKLINLGTGYTKIKVDKTKMINNKVNEGISEGFLKYVGVSKLVGKMVLSEMESEEIQVPNIVPFKFNKKVKWIYDNFIKKDMIFFVKNSIEKFKSLKLEEHKIILFKDEDNYDHMLLKNIHSNRGF